MSKTPSQNKSTIYQSALIIIFALNLGLIVYALSNLINQPEPEIIENVPIREQQLQNAIMVINPASQ